VTGAGEAPLVRQLLLFAPLVLLGVIAGVLHAAGRRAADPRRRRAYDIAWILTLLAGAPLWLVAAVWLKLL
jgi:hypothetical protein